MNTINTSGKERNAFVLSDDEILELARWAVLIEAHYGCPMDMEWAKDGDTGEPVYCAGKARERCNLSSRLVC